MAEWPFPRLTRTCLSDLPCFHFRINRAQFLPPFRGDRHPRCTHDDNLAKKSSQRAATLCCLRSYLRRTCLASSFTMLLPWNERSNRKCQLKESFGVSMGKSPCMTDSGRCRHLAAIPKIGWMKHRAQTSTGLVVWRLVAFTEEKHIGISAGF